MGDIMTSLIQNSFSKLSLTEKRGLLRRGDRSLVITSHSLDTMSNINFRFFSVMRPRPTDEYISFHFTSFKEGCSSARADLQGALHLKL